MSEWELVYENRWDDARQAFAVTTSPWGLRALGWIAWALGDWPALEASWGRLVQRYPLQTPAVLLPILHEACDELPAQVWLVEHLSGVGAPPGLASFASDVPAPPRSKGSGMLWRALGPVKVGSELARVRKRDWFALQPAAEPHACDLEQLGWADQESWWLAATEAEVTQATWCELECDPGQGKADVWVNGQWVLGCARRANWRWAGFPFRARVWLEGGPNQVVVRATRQQYAAANFRLRWVSRPVRSCRPGWPALAGLAAVGEEASGLWPLEELDPAAPDFALLKADYLSRLGAREQARQQLEELVSRYSDSRLLARLMVACVELRSPDEKH
ncbi:MAG: hypothetical protein AB7S38_24295 [Vulcanimicrobiota bacterium]